MVYITRIIYKMIKLFESKDIVSHYARHRPTWPVEVSQAVLNYAASVNNYEEEAKFHLVDVGCGSGQSTPMYAASCKKVLGLDPSAEQINHAKMINNFNNVDYQIGLGEEIPCAAESVDIVCCGQSAHWLDYDAFFNECRRVLKPKGCLCVYGYTMAEITVPSEKTIGHSNSLFQNFFKQCDFHPRRSHVDSRMFEFFEKLPSTNKTRDDTLTIHREWNLEDLEGYIQSWSGYQKLLQEGKGANLLQALIQEIGRDRNPKSCDIMLDWSIFMIFSGRPNT